MARTVIEVCACTRCSMMGSMEIADHVIELQRMLDDNDELKYQIDLIYISRPDLTEEDPPSRRSSMSTVCSTPMRTRQLLWTRLCGTKKCRIP